MEEKDTLYVSYEITENILVWLPVKSLLRFASVSKTWETTISNPVFSRTHFQHSKTSASQELFIEEHPLVVGRPKLIKIKDGECRVESVLKLPLRKFGPLSLRCCCDGLVIFSSRGRCHRNCHSRTHVLWNPSSRTFTPFRLPYKLDASPLFYGLCYDPLIKDYKFVISDMRKYYVVFYCINKYWTEIKEFSIDGVIPGACSRRDPLMTKGVCSDGALYWLPHYSDQYRYEIICFNPRDDTCKTIHKPKDLQENAGDRWYLASLGGRLCLSHNMNYISRIQMFIMKKDGDQDLWMDFITIDLSASPVPTLSHLAMPVYLTNENEIILDMGDLKFFAAYNPRKGTSTIMHRSSDFLIYFIAPYLDNLFFSCLRNNRQKKNQGAYEMEIELRDTFFFHVSINC